MNYDNADTNDKSMQEWFLWEDQTIGLPVIASMIDRGVPKDDVKQLIKNVNSSGLYYNDDSDSEKVRDFIFAVIEAGDARNLNQFIDKCHDIKNNQRN